MKHQKIEVSTFDHRGQISDIFYKVNIEHVAVIRSKMAGLIRGNHYHKQTTQHIFVIKGSLCYWYQPADKNQPIRSVTVKEHEMVSTPPFEVHALEILEPNEFIVFSNGLRGGADYEADTFRDIVILTPDMIGKQ